MFCRAIEIGLLGSRNAYALKEPYILVTKTRRGRNQHSLAFQIPSASKDVYKYSFFPQTIRDWDDLPESLISPSELSDHSVSKFTSLVLSFFLSILSRSNFDHHLRCGGWLNFEFSQTF